MSLFKGFEKIYKILNARRNSCACKEGDNSNPEIVQREGLLSK